MSPSFTQLALTNGTTPGAALCKNRMFSMTATGFEFAGVLNRADLMGAFKMMHRMKTLYHVALADLMDHARANHGEGFVQEAMAELGFYSADAAQATAIGKLPADCRHPELTDAHYHAVSKARLTPGEARGWLASAVKNKLSAPELSRAIKGGSVSASARDLASRRGGIATVQGLRLMFDTWERQVSKNDPMEQWDAGRLRSFLEEVAPIEKTIISAKARLHARS